MVFYVFCFGAYGVQRALCVCVCITELFAVVSCALAARLVHSQFGMVFYADFFYDSFNVYVDIVPLAAARDELSCSPVLAHSQRSANNKM